MHQKFQDLIDATGQLPPGALALVDQVEQTLVEGAREVDVELDTPDTVSAFLLGIATGIECYNSDPLAALAIAANSPGGRGHDAGSHRAGRRRQACSRRSSVCCEGRGEAMSRETRNRPAPTDRSRVVAGRDLLAPLAGSEQVVVSDRLVVVPDVILDVVRLMVRGVRVGRAVPSLIDDGADNGDVGDERIILKQFVAEEAVHELPSFARGPATTAGLIECRMIGPGGQEMSGTVGRGTGRKGTESQAGSPGLAGRWTSGRKEEEK